eukprot:5479280-Alexandrium_andersonii.AAC.1
MVCFAARLSTRAPRLRPMRPPMPSGQERPAGNVLVVGVAVVREGMSQSDAPVTSLATFPVEKCCRL